jgi:hypothetical protein
MMMWMMIMVIKVPTMDKTAYARLKGSQKERYKIKIRRDY